MRIILLLLIFTISQSQSQDTDCDDGYQCQKIAVCQSYQTETQKLKQYQRGSREFKRLQNNIKSWICNKKLRKVCCEVEVPQGRNPQDKENDEECDVGYQCQDNSICQSYQAETTTK